MGVRVPVRGQYNAMTHPAGAGPVQYNYGADNAGSEQNQSRGNNVSSLTSVCSVRYGHTEVRCHELCVEEDSCRYNDFFDGLLVTFCPSLSLITTWKRKLIHFTGKYRFEYSMKFN